MNVLDDIDTLEALLITTAERPLTRDECGAWEVAIGRVRAACRALDTLVAAADRHPFTAIGFAVEHLAPAARELVGRGGAPS